jgi:hypothetical protein
MPQRLRDRRIVDPEPFTRHRCSRPPGLHSVSVVSRCCERHHQPCLGLAHSPGRAQHLHNEPVPRQGTATDACDTRLLCSSPDQHFFLALTRRRSGVRSAHREPAVQRQRCGASIDDLLGCCACRARLCSTIIPQLDRRALVFEIADGVFRSNLNTDAFELDEERVVGSFNTCSETTRRCRRACSGHRMVLVSRRSSSSREMRPSSCWRDRSRSRSRTARRSNFERETWGRSGRACGAPGASGRASRSSG